MKRVGKIFLNMNLRNKLFLYVIIMGIMVCVTGGLTYFYTVNQIKTNALESMRVVIDTKCHTMEKELVKCENAIINIVRNKMIYDVIEEGWEYDRDGYAWSDLDNIVIPSIESQMKNNENIEQFTIYTRFDVPEVGNMLLHEERIENEDWYKKAKENYGLKWVYEDGKFFTVCEIINIWGKSSAEQKHVGTGYVKLKKNSIVESDSEEEYCFALVDESGKFLDKDETVKFTDDNILEINNKKYIYVSCKINGTPWEMVEYLPMKNMYSKLSDTIYIMIAVVFVCFGVVTALSIWFSYGMTKRIDKLCCIMNEIGKGNTDVEISVNSNDEIGIIASGLKDMQMQLNESIRILYKTKIEKRKQEINTLRAQINPHFLYNTLSTIKWMAIDEEAEQTAYLTDLLTVFYRTSLNKGKTVISFENELKNVKAYVDMELVVHNNSFDVVYDIDKKIYDYSCINFILQPIVENAIFHGVNMKEDNEEKGKIVISAVVDENITVSVSDNGKGMTEKAKNSVLKVSGKGYGLYAVHERIKLMFGDNYGIKIKSDATGTVVDVILPKVYSDDMMNNKFE